MGMAAAAAGRLVLRQLSDRPPDRRFSDEQAWPRGPWGRPGRLARASGYLFRARLRLATRLFNASSV